MKNLGRALLLAVWLAPLSCWAVPLITLDAGHEPTRPGAISSCQKKEYQYNDELVEALNSELGSYKVLLTRKKGEDVDTSDSSLADFLGPDAKKGWAEKKSLFARAAIANKAKADLFISIHHDSVPESDLDFDPKICSGLGGRRIRDAFKRQYRIGFNIFVYARAQGPDQELRKARSIRLARLLGKKLEALGRVASNYHLFPIEPCQSCGAVDAKLGVYSQDLAVLKNTDMPAILVEVGNLMDPHDEAQVSKPKFRKAFARALRDSLAEYFSGS